MIDGNMETLAGAALSHFEYAPTSKHAEIKQGKRCLIIKDTFAIQLEKLEHISESFLTV